ncbi:hypothetical protein NDU88_003818, partial [Pleurodeles waltl]
YLGTHFGSSNHVEHQDRTLSGCTSNCVFQQQNSCCSLLEQTCHLQSTETSHIYIVWA